MPDRKLVVVGGGPEHEKIKRKCKPNIELLGHQPAEAFQELMRRARAFVFAAEEDFGITMVEAQASGTPVIAFGRGGAVEIVRDLGSAPRPTGVLFPQQDVPSIIAAVDRFERNLDAIHPDACRENAMAFSHERFAREFRDYVESRLQLRVCPRGIPANDNVNDARVLLDDSGRREFVASNS